MKWFLKLGSCWGTGGATVTPAAETAQTSSTRKVAAPIRGHRTKNSATKHWKPKLHVISEDNTMNMMTDMNKRSQQRTVGTDKKPSVKVKPKFTAKVLTPPSHGQDYWKSFYPTPEGEFSPMPFLF